MSQLQHKPVRSLIKDMPIKSPEGKKIEENFTINNQTSARKALKGFIRSVVEENTEGVKHYNEPVIEDNVISITTTSPTNYALSKENNSVTTSSDSTKRKHLNSPKAMMRGFLSSSTTSDEDSASNTNIGHLYASLSSVGNVSIIEEQDTQSQSEASHSGSVSLTNPTVAHDNTDNNESSKYVNISAGGVRRGDAAAVVSASSSTHSVPEGGKLTAKSKPESSSVVSTTSTNKNITTTATSVSRSILKENNSQHDAVFTASYIFNILDACICFFIAILMILICLSLLLYVYLLLVSSSPHEVSKVALICNRITSLVQRSLYSYTRGNTEF